MTVIDTAVLERHGIKPDEYERIQQLMGREPNLLELGLFSVMWSEHCCENRCIYWSLFHTILPLFFKP